MKNYSDDNNEGNPIENDVQYSFLPETMKISKIEKLVANLHDREEYVTDIRNLKQALNHGLFFRKVHKIFKFNQKAWLKPYIDINSELIKKYKS